MATKYPNNFDVELNEPLDTKYVCDNLSDLTDYLYVGLLTYCRSDGKYYYIKEINNNNTPTWEELSNGSKEISISWDSTSNLNNYTTSGTYIISGIHEGNTDNMPITNNSTIEAKLVVLANTTHVCQILTLLNVDGSDSNIYVRTYDSSAWEPWGKMQTNIEVGQVNTLDNLTDNGIYSGVLTDGTASSVGSYYDTFVLIVINNYSVSYPLGQERSISQLKYSLDLGGVVSIQKRVKYGDTWGAWEDTGGSSKITIGTNRDLSGLTIETNTILVSTGLLVSNQYTNNGYAADIFINIGTGIQVLNDALCVNVEQIANSMNIPSIFASESNNSLLVQADTLRLQKSEGFMYNRYAHVLELLLSSNLQLQPHPDYTDANCIDLSTEIKNVIWGNNSGSSGDNSIFIGTTNEYSLSSLILSTSNGFNVNSSNELELRYSSDFELEDGYLCLSSDIKEQIESGGNSTTSISLGTGLSEYGGYICIDSDKFELGTGLIWLWGDNSSVDALKLGLNVGRGLAASSSFEVAIGSGLGFNSSNEIFVDIAQLTGKQDTLESGVNIKTINGNTILGSGDITINTELGASDFINGGVINITTTGDIEAIYNSLEVGAIALCIIGDSDGSYPSSETRVNVNSAYTTSTNYFFSEDARGANVGDLLMITKQSYLLVNRCALKIIPINDAKVATDEYTGTDGIMTVWDKTRINKVDGIEWTANDTRSWLNSVVNTDLRKTKYGYGTALEDCIKTGVLAYTNATINDITANWTIFVDCTTDTDGGGYYHLIQTAICRDEGEYLGRMWKRLGYYTSSTTPEFLEWKEITNAGLEARIAALEAQINSMITETEV